MGQLFFAKKIDLWGQIAMLLLPFLMLPLMARFSFLACYFTVGGWQLISAIATLAVNIEDYWNSRRRAYNIALLVCLIVGYWQ